MINRDEAMREPVFYETRPSDARNKPDEFNPAKRHWELDYDHERKAVVCTRCNKVLEERSYSELMFMVGSIFIKKNLPCLEQTDGEKQ